MTKYHLVISILFWFVCAAVIAIAFTACNVITQALSDNLENVPELAVPATPTPDATPSEVVLSFMTKEQSQALIAELSKQLSNLDKADYDMVARFCPKYKTLSIDQRVIVWAHLAQAIMVRENGSDFSKCSDYNEGDGTHSIGLFQLTYGDRFCPADKAHGDLCDAKVNIACGVKLMGAFVGDDRVVTDGGYVKYGAKPPRGLARYWSVTRMPDKKSQHFLTEIMDKTKQAPGCL